MNRFVPYFLCFFIVVSGFGCANSPSAELFDYCAAGGYQNCDASEDAGNCLESVGCDHVFSSERDTYLSRFKGNKAENAGKYSEGYVGKISPGCQLLKPEKYGGDVDWIAFETTPGDPLHISVTRGINCSTKPVVYLRNRYGNELIFQAPNSIGQANLDFLAPDSLFYISIEELENYQQSYKSSCRDSNMAGGDDYCYVVQVSSKRQNVMDLGVIGSKKEYTDSFSSDAAMIHYYQFKTDHPAGIQVTLKPADSKKYGVYPVVSALNRNADSENFSGGYDWVLYGKKLDQSGLDGDAAYQWHFDKDVAACSEDGCEYWLVVIDYYAFTDYDYTLTINLES
jgi:hypothetical protein